MHPLPRASALCALTAAALATALPTAPLSAPATRAVPARHASLVFNEDFRSADWGRRGTVWADRTTAYPDGVSDPADSKLDRVHPASMKVSGGQLHVTATAASGAHGPWRTGLLTTEPWHGGAVGGRGFQLRTGDYVVVRMRLPGRQDGGGHGGWPGVWTWRGGNEVDVMEWHSETPDIVEFTNHARGAGSHAWFHSPLAGFGKWITVGMRVGSAQVSWYLGDDTHPLRLAAQDRVGVGTGWHAYLIANLSVSGQPGRKPTATRAIGMAIDRIRVYR